MRKLQIPNPTVGDHPMAVRLLTDYCATIAKPYPGARMRGKRISMNFKFRYLASRAIASAFALAAVSQDSANLKTGETTRFREVGLNLVGFCRLLCGW